MEWYLKALKNYAGFSGRAQRKEYWFYVLFYIVFGVVVAFVEGLLGLGNPETGSGPLSMIYALAFLIPSIAVSVRRLHDTGRTGWWLLLALIPIIGALVLIYFYVLDSQPGDNEYGPNPKGVPV
jgi:uncharacterized membrane protein YhaH (DUF805 family)